MKRQGFLLILGTAFVWFLLGQGRTFSQTSPIIYRQFTNSEPPETSLFPTNVQPVYYSGPFEYGRFSEFPLDLNGDGVVEFNAISQVLPGSVKTSLRSPLLNPALGTTHGMILVLYAQYVIVGYDTPAPLWEGEVIRGEMNWDWFLWFWDAFLVESRPPLPDDWVFGSVFFVGLQFQIAGQTHYAWLRLQPFVMPTGATGVLLYDYAYESRPDTPIVVGAGLDSDQDGVWDFLDLCPDTPAGEIVDANGCSISQVCPCDGPWKNHGEYVRHVEQAASRFEKAGLITRADKHGVVKQAAISDCGNFRQQFPP